MPARDQQAWVPCECLGVDPHGGERPSGGTRVRSDGLGTEREADCNWERLIAKRDSRRRLSGRLVEGKGDPVIRNVDLSVYCQECGDRLDMRTDARTGELVEECRRCGTSRPVPRFRPVGQEEGPETPAS